MKDQVNQIVQESIESGVWYPCFHDLNNWSEWERFAALELLVAAVGFDDDEVLYQSSLLPNFTRLRHWFQPAIPQVEDPAQAAQDSDSVRQLRTVCDSILYAYLSRVADTPEKRHYLDLLYTMVNGRGGRNLINADTFLDVLHKCKVLGLHPSSFQPADFQVLFAAMDRFYHFPYYLETFRSDLERSKDFHYEGGLWHAFVATQCMRYLRTQSNSR